MSFVKFGSKKFGRFKWGQGNRLYIYDSLFEYLPTFINKDSKFLKGFLRALSTVLLEWQKAVYTLHIFHLTGFKGIKYANENWKILVTDNISDNDLINNIKATYQIHQSRGTEDGVLADLKRVTGDNNSLTEYYDETECAWWVDRTFPDISPQGLVRVPNIVSSYIDLDNMLFVKFYNKSGRKDSILRKLLLHEIIPIAINSTIIFLTPTTLKFGRFKMGLRKFGQLIYPR